MIYKLLLSCVLLYGWLTYHPYTQPIIINEQPAKVMKIDKKIPLGPACSDQGGGKCLF